jgi:NAD(P)-dependent dehydrogenase (short-subunit alcohol dehydrogenase family)
MALLDGKVAIVTGASRGIGQAIAELFSEEGAKVVCAARTFAEGDHPFLEGTLRRTVELIRAKGGEAKAVTANVSIEEDCIRLVQAARDYGPVDILVNNAALNYYQPIAEMQTNRWVRSFAVDVHGPFMLSKEVLKDMIPRRSGVIINISSGAAIRPGARAVCRQNSTRRRHVRCGEGGAGAVHPGLGARSRTVRWHRDRRGVALTDRAHTRYGVPQAGFRHGRSAR